MNNLRDPKPEELDDPTFNAIWNVIKGWDIRRASDGGYSGATGTDVCTILDAVPSTAAEAARGQDWEDEANLWRERCDRLVAALKNSDAYVADEVCAVIDSFECDSAPAAPPERGDEREKFEKWFGEEFKHDNTITKSDRAMARFGWHARAGLSDQKEGK